MVAFVFHIVRTQPTWYLNYSIPSDYEALKMYTLIYLLRKKMPYHWLLRSNKWFY